jgi:hypothetical protein
MQTIVGVGYQTLSSRNSTVPLVLLTLLPSTVPYNGVVYMGSIFYKPFQIGYFLPVESDERKHLLAVEGRLEIKCFQTSANKRKNQLI